MDRRQIGCLIGIVMLIAWVPVALAETVSEEVQRYMARGMAAVEMAETPKDYERAVREFEQAAKIAPNWPDVYFNLGSVQAKAGNYGEAMRHYKHYLELAPSAPDAAKVREEIYKLEYRAEEKAKVRNRFIAYSNGTVLDTQTDLMWAAKDNGANIDWKGAKSYCENYRGGGYTDWRMPTLDELGGVYDASKSYKSDCGYDVHLTELIRLTSTWVWTSETRGSDAETVGFLYGRHKLDPQSGGLAIRALPVRSGQSIVIEPNPKDADAYYNRGAAYRKKGMFDQAIEEFNKAVELNPKYVDAYVVRGSTYYLKRGHDQAISDYSKAIELNPKLAEAYNGRGAAYFGKKEYDKAWQDVHMAESLGAKEPPGFLDALKKASGREK